VRRKWDMVGWMLIYIIATPVFSFALPLLAFWKMDDFSWGNTRMVTGEKGKQVLVSDEGKFDPASIPKKHWEEYQAELWDQNTIRDDARSEISGVSYATKSYHPGPFGAGQHHVAASEFGGGYNSRPMSMANVPAMPSPYHMNNGSHMSLNAPSYTDRPGSTLGLSQRNFSETDMMLPSAGDGAGQPSDDAILAEIREILRTADLMTVTKKSIKAELERRFGVPMDARRQYIGSATEAILSGQL